TPDTIATATGIINLTNANGTAPLNPTAFTTATGTMTLGGNQPVSGNALATLALGGSEPGLITSATGTLVLGTVAHPNTGANTGVLTLTAGPTDGDIVAVGG